jgi:hypothetical protein
MILLVAAVLLAARFVVGSFRTAFVIVNSPANAAGTVAVSFLLLTLTANIDKKTGSGNLRVNQWVILASLTLIMAAAFWPNLGSAFVYDDYTHILQTSHATWRILADAFRREPGGHGLFFRPVAFISYWLDYQWAGPVAARWHAWSLAVDTANVCLLYLLTTRLGLRRMAATGAALVFALHGSRAETVAWSDARSDLLATLFCLIVLLAVLEYCRGGRKAFFVPMLLCAMLGVYTKESAFCLPLLPLTLLPFLHPGARRRAVIASGTLALGCALLFAYRWWALGGIGGYADRTGVSAVWHPSPLHSCEALCFRQWAYLFFPVNWVAPMEWWLRAAAVVFLGALIVCAGRSGASRLRLLAGIAFLLAADLPVQHLLMFQTDFAGARVLYLPVAGLAIFWGLLLEGIAQPWLKWATAAALVVFNLAALEHNLRPWRTTPEAAVRVCRALGSQMAHDPRPVVLSDLPDRKDGVYFLGNGFPECVEMNSGQPMGRVFVVGRSPAEPPVHAREFVWDAGPNRVEERHQK